VTEIASAGFDEAKTQGRIVNAFLSKVSEKGLFRNAPKVPSATLRVHGKSTLCLNLHTFMETIKTIFFDVGNTLLFPNQDVIYRPLREAGYAPDSNLLLQLEARTKQEFDDRMLHGTAVDHGFWQMFYGHLFEALEFDDKAICQQLVDATRVSANWANLQPGTKELLQHLKSRYKIAVISNADGKIREVLETNGIADSFATITDSGIVGYEKPHPAIFEAGLKSMNAAPEASLYVGDIYSVDYLGATAVGMKAILIDVCGAYTETQLPRIESLTDLERSLAELKDRAR